MTKHDILLDVQHVSHVFPLTKQVSVKALDDISFQIRRGEIFAARTKKCCKPHAR